MELIKIERTLKEWFNDLADPSDDVQDELECEITGMDIPATYWEPGERRGIESVYVPTGKSIQAWVDCQGMPLSFSDPCDLFDDIDFTFKTNRGDYELDCRLILTPLGVHDGRYSVAQIEVGAR